MFELSRRRPFFRSRAADHEDAPDTWTPERNFRADYLRIAGGNAALAAKWVREEAVYAADAPRLTGLRELGVDEGAS